ncbi:hypothetical protein KM176_21860 [Pseudooceanicola sp. CBS1P-1]|uniref:Sulfotransferase family protein n=1 Tax=Pseudooceanicola albus TaxID=2692189 RepID=A0A6L7G8I7_9RHOB|nr:MULTISPECIES: hypothetical protein [Pseudooceanicola]MBT9386521.1 hypothetical protein [Pseudooceanicola endophyticus]MXN20554.1 hypothetical protein [Pseudooceanicola albus]
MVRTLFFVHVPKCAGMSLMRALQRALPPEQVYQSTSLIANLREGRPEFLELPNPRALRAVTGHWLHEAMLPYMAGEIRFATGLRDPVARVKSQYRFDMGLRAEGWQPPTPEAFLARSGNVICNFLTAPFPALRGECASRLEAAKLVLSAMDTVFDLPGATQSQAALLADLGLDPSGLRTENSSAGTGIDWPGEDAEIRDALGDDLALYDWFRAAGPEGDPLGNPVFDPQAHDRLVALCAAPRRPHLLADYVARKLAHELYVETPNPAAMETRLWRRRIQARALHEAFRARCSG